MLGAPRRAVCRRRATAREGVQGTVGYVARVVGIKIVVHVDQLLEARRDDRGCRTWRSAEL
jgi:hypothetical protein